jgi:hypothetical protein
MMYKAPVYMTMLHYPILDKQGGVISTAVTNLDVHDGGRLCATYNIKRYFLVTPLEEQQALVHRIRGHWVDGPGARKTPTRRIAMEKALPASDLQAVVDLITEEEGQAPLLVGTSARPQETTGIGYNELRGQIWEGERPILLVFGTGWGIADSVTPALERFLPPILGPGTEYNHLSVRAAIAITIDRLLGRYEENDA